LQSEDKRLRTGASLVLSQLGPVVVEALLPYVEHSNPRLRASVIYVLGESGDGRAISVLTKALEDPVSRVSMAAAESLEKLLQAAIQPLLDRVAQDGAAKAQSIVTMGRLFHQVKPILENTRHQDPDDSMRKLASIALDGTNESIELVL
jgi:HEAT repeat protein